MKRPVYNRPVVFWSAMALFLLITIAVLPGANAAPPTTAPASDSILWAANVIAYQAGAGVGGNFGNPNAALGAPDAVSGVSGFVALGNALTPAAQPPLLPSQCEAHLIVDFGESAIFDGPGDDVSVVEVAAGGVAEATWVYVGREEEGSILWLYAGETGGSVDAIDISGVAGQGELFTLVALCDLPDGISSGSPFGGPDIDAIGGLNAAHLGVIAEPSGPGWQKNDDSLASGVTVPLETGDAITHDCTGDATPACTQSTLSVSRRCSDVDQALAVSVWVLGTSRPDIEYFTGFEFEEELDVCLDQGGQHATGPRLTFAHQRGALGFDVVESSLQFKVRATLAEVSSEGANAFTLDDDQDAAQLTVTATRGTISVAPTAAGEAPFGLTAPQRVTISADGVGPIIDLTRVYLPATLR